MTYKIEWVGCHPSNYEVGGAVDPVTRIKHKPIAIVNHIMEGSLEGTISWFNNPAAQASTNYGIGKNGRIVQFVKEGEDRPFANGYYCNPTWKHFIKRKDGSIVNPNRYTISIEHAGFSGEKFTEEMYQATLWLHKELIKKWNIPISREFIIGHYEIDACNKGRCPGTGFPWDRLMNDLKKWEKEMNDMAWQTAEGLKAVANLTKKGIINNPEAWPAEKMLESAPVWLIMTLIDRITDKK